MCIIVFSRTGLDRQAQENQTEGSLCAQGVDHSKLPVYPLSVPTCVGKRLMPGMYGCL